MWFLSKSYEGGEINGDFTSGRGHKEEKETCITTSMTIFIQPSFIFLLQNVNVAVDVSECLD